MRYFAYVLFALAFATVVLSVIFQVWATGIACSFSTSGSGACPWRMPWNMGHEDFLIFVTLPLGTATVLALLGWVALRAANRR